MNNGRRGSTALKLALAAAVLAAGGLWVRRTMAPSPAAAPAPRVVYQCPMHPQIVEDHPGFCPICHMRLEKVANAPAPARTAAAPAPARRILKYRSPMDPTVFSDHPMKDGMGMDYIPVYAAAAPTPAQAAAAPAGRADFTLTPADRQLIGVRTAVAEVRPLVRTISMAGRVESSGGILAELMELDAGDLKPGMAALVRRGPGRTSTAARVTAVDPDLDDLTRSFPVTLAPAGRAPWMRPGVFVEVEARCPLGRALAVPREAVLDTGADKWIFVTDGAGRFEPRTVVVGRKGDHWVEIRKGVRAGDEVVTSAQFLIDSESQFRAAVDAVAGTGGGHD